MPGMRAPGIGASAAVYMPAFAPATMTALQAYMPFFILLLGLVIVIGGIVKLRMHAFLALITAALVVSLLAPGAWGDKVTRVADAFGDTAAGVGVVIALAAIIGASMTGSGSADRIVAMFLRLLGEKRGAAALMASGFTLSVPVFFDTVFYLLVPLVRSMYRRTRQRYVMYLMAVATATTAHALVPPTPGPLVISQTLGVDIGVMILMGCLVGAPAALLGLVFARLVDRRMPDVTPPDDAIGEDAPGAGYALPGLAISLAPIVLPVALITLNTVAGANVDLEARAAGEGLGAGLARTIVVLGNPNMALLLSAAIALATLAWRRREDAGQIAGTVEHALLSGGMIVLITAAGGAFGGMLRTAGLADAVQQTFGDHATGGLGLLVLAFGVSALIKFAQGSSTAAMIVTSAMFAAMLSESTAGTLGFHPVYLALAIGSGSLVGSWMNDSGFWIFAKMGGLTEAQTLRTWTPLLALLGSVSMLLTMLLAVVVPGAFGLG
jgi:GntP family gluconate:H+ symporter